MCGLHREHMRIVDFFFTIPICLLADLPSNLSPPSSPSTAVNPKHSRTLEPESLSVFLDFPTSLIVSTTYPPRIHSRPQPALRRLRAVGQTNLHFETSDLATKHGSVIVTVRASGGKWRAASSRGESMQPTALQTLATRSIQRSSALGCRLSPRTPSPGLTQTFRCTSGRARCSRKVGDGLGSPSCEFYSGVELVL